MIFDLQNYQSHDYVVKDDKIGYKLQDTIIYNANYGYKTLFAYYYENSKDKITSISLEENKRIIIKCGTFSYAEIVKDLKSFKYIMGVTGTLKTLSPPEKKVVE